MSNYVFVLDANKTPLQPTHPSVARKLLKQRKASVFRRYPFTIILKEVKLNVVSQPIELKLDPGSKTTGVALVSNNQVIWGAELKHRGHFSYQLSVISYQLLTINYLFTGNCSLVTERGELQGYEIREYLLEKWGRNCVYCGKKDVPLEIEHIKPKSLGGSNRISNLTLACKGCNQKKGSQLIDHFLSDQPQLLQQIKTQAKQPLKDATAVNTTRWQLFNS